MRSWSASVVFSGKRGRRGRRGERKGRKGRKQGKKELTIGAKQKTPAGTNTKTSIATLQHSRGKNTRGPCVRISIYLGGGRTRRYTGLRQSQESTGPQPTMNMPSQNLGKEVFTPEDQKEHADHEARHERRLIPVPSEDPAGECQ